MTCGEPVSGSSPIADTMGGYADPRMHAKPEPDLLIIGLRGSGKSTLARALSAAQRRERVDLDDLTLLALGCATASEAWNTKGVAAFRDAEASGLRRLIERPAGRIVALGGGTPTAPGAADAIERAKREGRAVVVYLRASPESLASRLRASGGAGANRPSLTGADPIDEIAAIYAQRDPLYLRLASRTIEGVDRADEAVRLLESWPEWAAG